MLPVEDERAYARNDGMKSGTSFSTAAREGISLPSRNNSPKRFQVLVEYGPGEYVTAAVSDSAEDAVEDFMLQAPGCEHGDILLCDSDELRVVASVKWKTAETERGPSVPQRGNLFKDWHLGLIALAVQRRHSLNAWVDLIG